MIVNEIEWQDGDGLESLATWARCAKTILEIIEDKAADDEPDAYALTLVAVNMLAGIDKCLYRFLDEIKGRSSEKADEDTPGQEDEGIINKADDSVMKKLDNVLCKAEVLEKAFKGFEQWDLNGADPPKFDHSFFAGLAIIAGDINEEINDIASDLM